MSKFLSHFAKAMESMLEYRTALGLSVKTLESRLTHVDRYCADNHPESAILTKEMVFGWLDYRQEKRPDAINADARSIRQLGAYLSAIGCEAYILPEGFYPIKSIFSPYIFTDREMISLFYAIDNLQFKNKSTESLVAPVLFRLIYTCGLRPNEGRELLHRNINLDIGEIFVTNTKMKKERLVVMSDDMVALCRSYLIESKADRNSEYFFPRFDGKAYTASQIDRLFKKCWEMACPDAVDLPNVRTYDLRHRHASARLNRWLDGGRDLNAMLPYLKAYMGHNSLNETAYYIHILPENIVKTAGVNWDALNNLLPEVSLWQS